MCVCRDTYMIMYLCMYVYESVCMMYEWMDVGRHICIHVCMSMQVYRYVCLYVYMYGWINVGRHA